MNTTLSPSEREQYRLDGYVIPDFRFPESRVLQLREAMDRLIAKNPSTRPEQLVSAHITDRRKEGVSGDDVFFELATDPAILDLVEPLIGPNIILWGCQAFCKPGGDGMEVPMHQDGHYWPIDPLATCTAWVAIDDSTPENGCMKVIPRSHRTQELRQHQTETRTDVVLNQRVESESIAGSQSVDIELQAGQLSLHDVFLIHGSNANRSTKRRAGIAIRYMPASSHFRRDWTSPVTSYTVDFAERPIWLLRGQDVCGANDFTVGH